jgi:hypothetical protein
MSNSYEEGIALLNRAIREGAAILDTPEARLLHLWNCAAFGVECQCADHGGV